MKNNSSPIRRGLSLVFDGVGGATFAVAGLVLAAMTLLIVSESLSRTFLGVSMDFVHELTGYGVVAMALIGGAASFRRGGFFSVSFIYDHLPAVLRRTLRIFYIGLSLIYCAALCYYCLELAMDSYKTGDRSSTILATPLYIPQILMPIGFALLVIFLVEAVWRGEDRSDASAAAERAIDNAEPVAGDHAHASAKEDQA